MTKQLTGALLVLLIAATCSVSAQTSLAGRVYHNPNVLKAELTKKINEANKDIGTARKEAIAKAEKKKGRKLTEKELAELDKKIKEGKDLMEALKTGMKTEITIEFKNDKEVVSTMKMKVSDAALKAGGVGWLKRKAMLAALAIAPSSQKGPYVVKGNMIILPDEKEPDTLFLSADGKQLSGKMDKDTKFVLTRIK